MKIKQLLIITFLLSILCTTSCKTKDKKVDETESIKTTFALLNETINLTRAESVAYSSKHDLMYVSVQGKQEPEDGSIAVLNSDGTLNKLAFTTGLNDPKGIAIKDDLLYVSDVTELVKIDLNTGDILEKYIAGDEGFLNDVTIDQDGNVYVSDMSSSSIYKLDKNGTYAKWLTTPLLENPNGLLAVGNTMYVAAWGLPESKNEEGYTQGRFLKLDISTQKIKKVTDLPLGNLDGIQVYDKDHFLVSDWRNGKLYKISKTGETQLFMQSEASLGDILYISDKQILALPLNKQAKVEIYSVN